MKTAVIALVAIVAAGSLFARDLNINGEFKRLNTAGTAPLGWVKNYANQRMSGHSRSFRQERPAKMPFR